MLVIFLFALRSMLCLSLFCFVSLGGRLHSFHCKLILVKLDKEVLEDSKIEVGGGNHSFSLGHPQGKVVIPSPTLYFSVDSPSHGWYSSWSMVQVGGLWNILHPIFLPTLGLLAIFCCY